LRDELGERANVTVVHGDALKSDYTTLAQGRPVRFVSNLPYYISGHAIRTLLEAPVNWRSIVLTLQLEVAQRIVAQPPDMSLLALSVQFYGQPEVLFRLPSAVFYPPPNVDSATIRIRSQRNHGTSPELLFRVAKPVFAQPRKQIRNIIASQLGISKGLTEDILIKSGITPDRRPGTLTVDEWVKLACNTETYLKS
jgi:16S rRNA (adenine1518-N6/adenine1519-N6)-dimethyltransferase